MKNPASQDEQNPPTVLHHDCRSGSHDSPVLPGTGRMKTASGSSVSQGPRSERLHQQLPRRNFHRPALCRWHSGFSSHAPSNRPLATAGKSISPEYRPGSGSGVESAGRSDSGIVGPGAEWLVSCARFDNRSLAKKPKIVGWVKHHTPVNPQGGRTKRWVYDKLDPT